MSFSIPAPSSGVAVLASFRRSWHSHIPFGLLFNFQGTVRRSFTYSHRERSNAPPKREKYLRIKNSLHSFGQRVPKCTPISGLFLEKFFKKKFTLHLFGITKPNDTLFHRKNEKIFFIRLRALYFACPENAFLECYTISAVDKAPKIWYNKEQETRKEGKEDGTL